MATTIGPVFMIHPVQNQVMNVLSVSPLYLENSRKFFHEKITFPVYPLEEFRQRYCADNLIDLQMKTKIPITKNTLISDTQKSFQGVYNYLSIQFFKKPPDSKQISSVKKFFVPNQTFGKVTLLKKEGEIVITNTMTVGELIEEFNNTYGLNMQVLRKSGNLWLEITLTANWTLEQQNHHAQEISIQ